MLLEDRRFAKAVVDTLRHQHRPNLRHTISIACVFAVNQIGKTLEMRWGDNRVASELPRIAADRLGGSLDELILPRGGLAPLFEEAKLFPKI